MNWAVFLDRDGTINREVHHLSNPDELELLPGAGQAIHRLNEAGVPVILITNQSVIGRGFLTEKGLAQIHWKFGQLLAAYNAHLDAIYHCPHHPDDGCDCRKPNPGMFTQAAQDHAIDLSQSYYIGDNWSDMAAGHRAGCSTVLVLTGYGESVKHQLRDTSFTPDFIAQDLQDGVNWIIEKESLET